MWGIHNDKPQLDFVDGGFIAVGWSRLGDLRRVGDDREAVKAAVAAAYPDARPRAIAAWAGILLRFAYEMQPGDVVVHPEKADSTLSFGRLRGGYRWEGAATLCPHRRAVDWLATGVPREAFSRSAGYELGCSLTLFKVRRHEAELAGFMAG